MKKTKLFLLLIAMLSAIAITTGCGGGGGGGDGGGGTPTSAPTPTPTPTSVNLPETGQTICYDAAGAVVACANTGQDGELQKGVVWPSPRFTVDGTGLCVTDNLTGLMWVRTPDSVLRTWQAALDYANNLTLCGYSDWRLPNRKELRSLINYGQANTATWLNTQGFSNVQAYIYWSSSTYAGNPTYGWIVSMWFGHVYGGNKAVTLYVWPVRAGQ
ncbi:MAG: DUF1566 domain-containing protein [Nitrospirota bacterium]